MGRLSLPYQLLMNSVSTSGIAHYPVLGQFGAPSAVFSHTLLINSVSTFGMVSCHTVESGTVWSTLYSLF